MSRTRDRTRGFLSHRHVWSRDLVSITERHDGNAALHDRVERHRFAGKRIGRRDFDFFGEGRNRRFEPFGKAGSERQRQNYRRHPRSEQSPRERRERSRDLEMKPGHVLVEQFVHGNDRRLLCDYFKHDTRRIRERLRPLEHVRPRHEHQQSHLYLRKRRNGRFRRLDVRELSSLGFDYEISECWRRRFYRYRNGHELEHPNVAAPRPLIKNPAPISGAGFFSWCG